MNKEVPDEITLTGNGLSEMAPERYAEFVHILGQMGIRVSEPYVDIFEPQRTEDGLIRGTLDEFRSFGKNNGYSKPGVGRVFEGLKRIHRAKKSAQEVVAADRQQSSNVVYWLNCPLELRNITTGPTEHMDQVVVSTETLPPLMDWILGPKRIYPKQPFMGIGAKGLSFLADYINNNLNPENPYPLFKERFYPVLPIPPAEDFRPEYNSPFLDDVLLDGTDMHFQLVTVEAIRRKAAELGLEPQQTSYVRLMFEAIAQTLVEERLPRKKPGDTMQLINADLMFIRAEQVDSWRERVVWGIEPSAFVKIVSEDLLGEQQIYGIKSNLSQHIISHYVESITKPSETT